MHESATYERIIREGRVFEARRLIILAGRKRFPEPDPETIAAIEAINDIDRLEAICDRTIDPEIHDWKELLDVGSIDSDSPGIDL